MSSVVQVLHLGRRNYLDTFAMMKAHAAQRQADWLDEFWLVEHEPVYTLGRAAKPHNLLNTGNVPVVQSDRGGDVTYHGPGQVVLYLLCDLKRLGLNVRQLVSAIEACLVDELAQMGIVAHPRVDAPGVYVGEAKIASLGLRVSKSCTYHGLALNVNMDMRPWLGINACALGVPVTQVADLTEKVPPLAVMGDRLVHRLAKQLGYRQINELNTEISNERYTKTR